MDPGWIEGLINILDEIEDYLQFFSKQLVRRSG
jgi:hypothetical protein